MDESPDQDGDQFQYPDAELILDIHRSIVAEYPDTDPGIRTTEAIESALHSCQKGTSDKRPTRSTKKRRT
jgi:death-on-curing protein